MCSRWFTNRCGTKNLGLGKHSDGSITRFNDFRFHAKPILGFRTASRLWDAETAWCRGCGNTESLGYLDAVFIFWRCLTFISTSALFFFCFLMFSSSSSSCCCWCAPSAVVEVSKLGMLTFLQLVHAGDSHPISITPAVVGCIMTGFEVETKVVFLDVSCSSSCSSSSSCCCCSSSSSSCCSYF